MQQYIETLRKEMKPQSINIVQFQLGLLDYGPALSENQQLVLSQYSPRAEFARQRLEQKGKKPVKGVSMRELHNGVFDAIVRCKGRNRTVFVGRGSRTYDLVGKWVPSGMVGWMMGVGKTSRAEGEEREKSVEGSAEWDKVDDDDDRYVYPRKR